MITRFDHVVIAVQDLDAALADYTRLGFDVSAGGRHPSLGTHNAIVRFGLDYIELLAIEDQDVARARGAFGVDLARFLATGNGLVGFALASAGLEDEAHGLARIALAAEGPFAMERQRPDGRTLAWRLVLPGASPWRKPWPFLIEWATPDAERLLWDPVGAHGNGVCGVRAIDLLVADVSEAVGLYEDAWGLTADRLGDSASARSYQLGTFLLHVHSSADDATRNELKSRGPGPWRVHLATPSVDASAAWLRRAGVSFELGAGYIDIAPEEAQGARLRLVTA